jgi:hypothetical protein
LFAAPPFKVIRSGPNSIELRVAGATDHHFMIETGGKKRNKLAIRCKRGGCLAKVNGCSVAIMGSLPRLSLKSLAVGGLSTDSPSWQGEILNFSVAAVGKRVANRSIKRESALTRIAARLGLGGSR